MKKLIRLFFQGILLVAPLALTIYILIKIFKFLDSILESLVGDVPGLGLLTLVSFLVFVGFLGDTFIAAPIKTYFNKLIAKVPIIKQIYDSVKDLFGAFLGNKKKFHHPVMVKEHSDATCYKVGFVTQESLESIGIQGSLSSVYFPHSYAFSGVVLLVENEYLVTIDKPAADIMKFIVSGGVLSNENLEKSDDE